MMRVISVGGGDHAIFQWRYLPDGSHDDEDDVDGGAYLESNSDDSDSEASDADELDSDIENVSIKQRWVVLDLLFQIWSSKLASKTISKLASKTINLWDSPSWASQTTLILCPF